MDKWYQLSAGYVTQNGSWISYKTKKYTRQIADHQNLANELKDFLDSHSIRYDEDAFEIVYAAKHSYSRSYCVTIKVSSADKNGMDKLPFVGDSIN